ncbi:MAG: 4-hydroxy-tetrahydrodipicolinate synthase [Candidatus Binatus sp.]|uniref:4-hydroxy-tetrahydrodipicolinate synthase n=1 Tax=Candidatus Binatus sp. TaxID=2811406 RepID=UPI00271C28D6|nr:4-hydroxy-tetrahydrodipicolinate synthase [Candidatus Binatus sp.]MDO8434625.1 4-hydroxy-tetrahydrodipicolinate synthase [Candidatus Binatus sp.]
MFNGALTALVTPFRDGSVDETALRDLIEWQIQSGIDGLVPCGSTGESATLSHSEHDAVIKITIEQTRRRVPVVAGTGSNSTAEAIRLTAAAREMGADGALLISPYYNKPTQDGIFRHYKTIAASVDLPLIVYNIPGRTGSNIAPETFARLAEIKNVVGVKEASGSMDQSSDILHLCGEKLTILSGDDALTLPLMSLGAKGVISTTSNIMPREMHDLAAAALGKDFDRAREIHFQMLPVMRALFIETNPIPVKQALAFMGKCANELRMPLVTMTAGLAEKLRTAMKESHLI